MSIKYKETNVFGQRFDAKVGHLYVGGQDNGEGWFNWWIALAEQGPAAGDHAILESGGAPTWTRAKVEINKKLRGIVDAIQKAMR